MRLILISLVFSALSIADPGATTYPVKIGKFESRAYWTVPPCGGGCKPRPAVILVPGSGTQGPEEMMPGSLTEDGKKHSVFAALTNSFVAAGYNVLAIGKPGVEYFTSFDPAATFYDKNLYENLKWKDLVTNVAEAFALVKSQPTVDEKAIYLLGHSEGTQVIADFAQTEKAIRGLFLLGYFGDDVGTLVRYQIFSNEIENFFKSDVDADKNGFVTVEEAAPWKEFKWNWAPGQKSVSIGEIADALKNDPAKQNLFKSFEKAPLYSDGVFLRGNVDNAVASLSQSLYVFNGELDVLTPKEQALNLGKACLAKQKTDCQVTIVPKVGHVFSAPRAPRRHPLLDITFGGVHKDFLTQLQTLAETLQPKL